MSRSSGTRSISVEHAIAYALLTAIGLFACITAIGYGLFKENLRVGPGLVPAVVGGGIALIAGWELIKVLRGRRIAHDQGLAAVTGALAPADPPPSPVVPSTAVEAGQDEDVDIYGRNSKTRTRQLMVVFAALVMASLLTPVIGFLEAFFLLSLFISAVVERRRWLPSGVISLAAVLVIYAVFVLFLNVPLPEGVFGIGG